MKQETLYIGFDRLPDILKNYHRIFVLVDANTRRCCLPILLRYLDRPNHVIEISAGEKMKTLSAAVDIWKQMMAINAGRDSLLINLGGGVVSDIGGFVASCYQRGVGFINIPTTLLAMVDASIGGKNGVDFEGYKNQIGTFCWPDAVFICTDFLNTLPQRELCSGLAEMIKYGFVSDEKFLQVDASNYTDYIVQAAEAKMKIVAADALDHGIRQSLNFGHTIGHAIESWSLETSRPLLHGEAVAIGMYSALWLSEKLCGLDEKYLTAYQKIYKRLFSPISMDQQGFDPEKIVEMALHDKKKQAGNLCIVLISELRQVIFFPMSQTKLLIESLFSWQKFTNEF